MKESGYVLLPQPIQKEAVNLLKEKGLEVVIAPNLEPEMVALLMKDARAIVLRTGIKMTPELMDRSQELLTISRTGAGFDNVDLEAATERGIIVTSSIGVNTESVAEHCLALMFCLFKQLFILDREARAGNFKIRYKNYPRELKGKTLGVIGFGRIGSLLADKCHRVLGMKILAHDPYLAEELQENYAAWVDFVDIDSVFRAADIISVHIPLTDATRDFISMKHFRMMKPDAFFINASRGGVVSEGDLIEALQKGMIAGAGLDVFEKEPVEKGNPLLTMDNVILTPHVAALTAECVVKMAVSAVERVIDVFSGVKPPNISNADVLAQKKWQHLKK